MNSPWTTQSLYEALTAASASDLDGAQLSLLGGVDPTISVTMPEHGDLLLQLAASGERIFVSTPLCHASEVKDRNSFNEACLRLGPLTPLSSLGLQTVGGDDVYIVFGELSSRSSLHEVVEEIRLLADNTLQAAEAFVDQLK